MSAKVTTDEVREAIHRIQVPIGPKDPGAAWKILTEIYRWLDAKDREAENRKADLREWTEPHE